MQCPTSPPSLPPSVALPDSLAPISSIGASVRRLGSESVLAGGFQVQNPELYSDLYRQTVEYNFGDLRQTMITLIMLMTLDSSGEIYRVLITENMHLGWYLEPPARLWTRARSEAGE